MRSGLRYVLRPPERVNARIISRCLDIRMRATIMMGCLSGSASKSHIYDYICAPPVIQDHKKQLAGCTTTKAIVSFPADKKIPMALVKKLVKASVQVRKDKSK